MVIPAWNSQSPFMGTLTAEIAQYLKRKLYKCVWIKEHYLTEKKVTDRVACFFLYEFPSDERENIAYIKERAELFNSKLRDQRASIGIEYNASSQGFSEYIFGSHSDFESTVRRVFEEVGIPTMYRCFNKETRDVIDALLLNYGKRTSFESGNPLVRKVI